MPAMGGREELESYLVRLFDCDPVVRRLTKAILRAQKRLRGSVDDAAWLIFLRLEAMTNHRHDEVVEKVRVYLNKRSADRGRCRRWPTTHERGRRHPGCQRCGRGV